MRGNDRRALLRAVSVLVGAGAAPLAGGKWNAGAGQQLPSVVSSGHGGQDWGTINPMQLVQAIECCDLTPISEAWEIRPRADELYGSVLYLVQLVQGRLGRTKP